MNLTKYEEAFIANAIACGEVVFADNYPVGGALSTLVKEHAKRTPPLAWTKKVDPEELARKIDAMPPHVHLNLFSTAIEMLKNAGGTKIERTQEAGIQTMKV